MELKSETVRRRKRSATEMEAKSTPANAAEDAASAKAQPAGATPLPLAAKGEEVVEPVDKSQGAPEAPKVIMSHAQRRKLKKPPVVVTAAMKEKAREEKKELRKYLRMIKSNGSRRKLAKFLAKRRREEAANEEEMNAFDTDYRVVKRGRRLE